MTDHQILTVATEPLATESTTDAPTTECGCCAHAWEAHDATARRYCAATLATALTRGCICR
jgi:hypothetical protein